MRLTHLLPIAALGLVVLTGCGDDKDEPKTDADEATSSHAR